MLVGIECERRYLHLILILACEIIGATSVSVTQADVAAADPILSRCEFLCVGRLPEHAMHPVGHPVGHTAGLLHLTQQVIDRIARLPLPHGGLSLLDTCPHDQQILRLVRTSGSTGRPKAMAMSQQATRRLLHHTTLCEGVPNYEWNFINLYDLALRSALMESSLALRAGKTVVSSHFETVFADMARFAECRVTLVSGDAARLVETRPAGWPGPHPCLLAVKGGPLSPAIRKTLLREVATDVAHTYAAIETYRLTMIDETGEGTLCPDVSIRIVDSNGRMLADGQVGLIEARSATMADGYLWDPDATRAAFVDGWYRTNDIGYLAAPNRLVVLGRADDVLNVGGVKFAPLPLEQRIKAIEGVNEAVLIAMPNATGMDELNVVMELQASARLQPIRARIGEIVAPYVRIYHVHDVASLPRTTTGKVRRNDVRALLLAQ
jgi:acyl-coenzyme A synthetase/AMP-(fatty) acid ligase